jgi:hypothetical protein
MKTIDMTGTRVGRLEVIERVGTRNRQALWMCRCDCGNETQIVGNSLRRKSATQSCGCFHREVTGEVHTIHGHHGTRTYTIWKGIKARCFNANDHNYFRYGARGISMCEQWRSSFEAFLSDMGECPSQKHSIDRIDNAGDYEPGNCRWATRRVQANNARSNVRITFRGETKTLKEWSRSLGFDYKKVHQRLHTLNWDVDRAFLTP